MTGGAANIINGVESRLAALAADPPFRFRGNTAAEVDVYFQRQRTFVGYTEHEVVAAELRSAVTFPEMYRAFLLRMGRAHGQLFVGSDPVGLGELMNARDDARAFLKASQVEGELPDKAVVFLWHQGYSFLFLIGDGRNDGPVWQYVEGRPAPEVAAPSFEALLDNELQLMEGSARNAREDGGYYVTVSNGRIVSQVHPALADGNRPLDRPQRFRTWWAPWR